MAKNTKQSTPSPRTLGEEFRRRRERKKLSQAQAGMQARPPVLQKTISAIETGSGDPTLSSLTAYALALGAEIAIRSLPRARASRK